MRTSEVILNESPSALWPGRYQMLDGWRALAALTVVCHHLGFGSQQNAAHRSDGVLRN